MIRFFSLGLSQHQKIMRTTTAYLIIEYNKHILSSNLQKE